MKIGTLRESWLLMILAIAPMAIPCEISDPDWLGPFETRDAALQNVATVFAADSARLDIEFAGAVVEEKGLFHATAGIGCRYYKETRFRLPRNSIALWHTHGRTHAFSEMFSELDAEAVQKTELPLFLVVDDELLVLEPGMLRRGRVRPRNSVRTVHAFLGRPYPLQP